MQVERSVVFDILRQCHIFLSLTDEQLEKVADRIEAFSFEENTVIFEQGGAPDNFYFVFSGRVKISRTKKTQEELALFDTRDYFGEEAISQRAIHRHATATALSEVIVLSLSVEDIRDLRVEFPSIDLPLQVVLNSYLLTMSLKMEWRAPREVVHYIARRHWMFLILRTLPVMAICGLFVGVFAYMYIVMYPGALVPLTLFIFSLIGLLAWVIWLVIDWTNDFAVVTNRRVVKLEKVMLIYDSRQEVPLDAVLADDLKTDQIGRWLDYGNIIVRTYTGVIVLNRQAHPMMVINLINEMRNRKKFRHRHEQLDLIDRTIRQRIEHRPTQKTAHGAGEAPIHIKAGILQEFLSEMFLLRIVEGSNLIYRTHWMILIKKIGLPTLLIIVQAITTLLIWLNLLPVSPSIGSLLAVVLGPILFIWWVYQYVDWRNDRYIITPELIMDVYKKPLGTEERRTAPLRNILSIDYQRKDIIGLVFNFGTVYIKVGDTTFTFDNVVNPAEVQRELFQYFMEYKQREEARNEQERNDQMADWIERYHDIIEQDLPDDPGNEI